MVARLPLHKSSRAKPKTHLRPRCANISLLLNPLPCYHTPTRNPPTLPCPNPTFVSTTENNEYPQNKYPLPNFIPGAAQPPTPVVLANAGTRPFSYLPPSHITF